MPKFDNVFLPDTLVVQSNRSVDFQVLTSILQNLMVSLDGTTSRTLPRTLADPPLVASRTATVIATLEGDEPTVTVQAKIQGTVNLEPGARVVLFARLAGSTFVDDLTPYAGKDFEFLHTVKVAPKSGCLATLILLADRDWVDGKLPTATASVNFMELTFVPPPSKTG